MGATMTRSAPTVAGVVVIAADTGRMLMLQRGLDDDSDPAAGTWEWPGGHLEASDNDSLAGGQREWAEEVGRRFPRGGTVEHTWTSSNGVYQGHVVVIDREDQVNLAGRRTVANADDDYSEQAAWWRPEDARRNPALRRECRSAPWDEMTRISRRVAKSGDLSRAGKSLDEASSKDMYASMAPMTYTRGLGASPTRPSQSPPPTIVGQRRGPALRGQIRRLKRRSRRTRVKGLADARARLTTKSGPDPDLREIVHVASGRDQVDRLRASIARLEGKVAQRAFGDERCLSCGCDIDDWYDTVDGEKHGYAGMNAVVCLDCVESEQKGAPSRMPPHLMTYWANGRGRARWATSPTPYRTLRALLRRYGVGGMSVDGATANVMRRATGLYPGQRPGKRGGNRGFKSMQEAAARIR